MATQVRQGEPYDLRGKRLAFTDYTYIRPAGFGWYDDQGNQVSVVGDQGDWDAHIRVSDRPYGFRIRAFPAERSEEPFVLPPEMPWEGAGINLDQILFDDDCGLYRAWGTCRADENRPCYMESKDFLTWTRPSLGVVEFEGNRNNNLIDTGPCRLGHGALFRDPSSEEEKWKFIFEGEITREEYDAYRAKYPQDWDPKSDRVDVPYETHIGNANLISAPRGAVSSDGFRWKVLDEPLVVEHSDTIITGYYDPNRKKYIGYFRDWMIGDRSLQAPDDRGLSWMAGRRSIGRAESDDFHHFPLSRIICEPGPDILGPSDVLYTNCHTFVPGTVNQHLFFPTVWHTENDSTSVFMASSRDGEIIHWIPNNPVLKTAAFMSWDGGCVFACGNLLELPDGTWVLPYQGSNYPHKYPRKGPIKSGSGLAAWKSGRAVGIETEQLGGFTTYAVMAPGIRLMINALSVRGGSVKVEITDLQRKVIPGRSFNDCVPVVGDQPRTLVKWKSGDDMGVSLDTPICLRFQLDQAQLFYIDFE